MPQRAPQSVPYAPIRAPRVVVWLVLLVGAMGAISCSVDPTGRPTGIDLEPNELAKEIDQALRTPDPLERSLRLGPLLEQLSPESLEVVKPVYKPMLPLLGEADLQLFLSAWARFDAPGALDYILDFDFAAKKELAVETLIFAWALRDPESARAAATRAAQMMPRSQEAIGLSLVAGWAQSDHSGLEAYLRSFPASAADPLLGMAINSVGRRHGDDGAMAWSKKFIETDSEAWRRGKTLRKTIRSIGYRNPEKIAPWALAWWGEEFAEDAPGILAEAWAQTNPRAALEWVEKQAPAEARARAAQLAYGRWLILSRKEAIDWLTEGPSPVVGDSASLAYARFIAKRQPETGIEWCEKIGDKKIQTECFFLVARIWYQADAIGAGQWLEQSSLSPRMRMQARGRGAQ